MRLYYDTNSSNLSILFNENTLLSTLEIGNILLREKVSYHTLNSKITPKSQPLSGFFFVAILHHYIDPTKIDNHP